VKTTHIVADFGSGREVYDKIRQQLQSLDVGILVNNVGMAQDFPDDFDCVSEDVLWQMVDVNVGATVMMSRMVIPQMKSKRRGMIVNISSVTQEQPTPLATAYSASKAFVKFLTLGNG
jgi:17beta-estradiol 17-dehydrogenase / very-long-chain 3-oxoacyl-CoA reductase